MKVSGRIRTLSALSTSWILMALFARETLSYHSLLVCPIHFLLIHNFPDYNWQMYLYVIFHSCCLSFSLQVNVRVLVSTWPEWSCSFSSHLCSSVSPSPRPLEKSPDWRLWWALPMPQRRTACWPYLDNVFLLPFSCSFSVRQGEKRSCSKEGWKNLI